ncbi:amidohydrolase family protein [Microvirga antarctica]|uniref:amidohydrolase family protein n=1 Tax=Microvirga antarctica TaxID=2819233 RepID=UPI001B30F2D2|nr:amidohydrolase family protein [Microvirga antarctica]
MVGNDVSRRDVLAALGSAGLLAGLSSCAHLPATGNLCRPDPRRGDPRKRLTIDTHAHVFNASDVQVKGLLTQVIARDEKFQAIITWLSPALQDFYWTSAPNRMRELQGLGRIKQALAACGSSDPLDQDAVARVTRDLRQEAYTNTLSELRASNERTTRAFSRRRFSEIDLHLRQFPDDAEAYFEKPPRSRAMISRGRIDNTDGAFDFIFRQGQYRCVNWLDYVRTIGLGREREVDLAVGHLLDFDWPLGGGRSTATTIPDQIDLMSRLSILSQGRIHGFAPFDPMRAVMHQAGPTPLAIVSDAVENQGFIGVKIYPPMGFAPFGNAEIEARNPAFWQQPWLPAVLKAVPDLGQRLDDKLAELYVWCRTNDVPIMTHTNQSMGPSRPFETLATAAYWEKAVAQFPGLRVNFGHFGETDPVVDGTGETRRYIRLMQKAGSPGENLFADSGYFSEVLNEREKLRTVLRDLQTYAVGAGAAPLYDRLMFGTDWEMTSLIGRKVGAYQADFESLFSELDQARGAPSASDRFFGLNAATFLGLRKGDANRRRIERFYGRNAVPTPLWMEKVDGRVPVS